MASTYKDIQNLTGLSLSTISRFFNGEPVRPANAKAIEEAASALDFNLNVFGRSLRTQRSTTVGMLIPDLANVFHAQIATTCGELLRERGYGMIVGTFGGDGYGIDEAIRFQIAKRIDGLIVVPPTESEPVGRLPKGFPVVAVDRTGGSKVNLVCSDNLAAGRSVAQLLYRAGHGQNIAILAGPRELSSTWARAEGLVQEMADIGVQVDPKWIRHQELTAAAGERETRWLWSKEERPSAIFATNAELMTGATIAFTKLGLSLPDDVSFVGFDNEELAAAVAPGLAVVTQPITEIARAAVTLLMESVEGADGEANPASTIMLPTSLKQGGSVGSPPCL